MAGTNRACTSAPPSSCPAEAAIPPIAAYKPIALARRWPSSAAWNVASTWVTALLLASGRDGFVILSGRAAPAATTTAPVRCYRLDEIDVTGVLRQSLAATDSSVHIVRPDGHLAAVLPRSDSAAVTEALGRATGCPGSLPGSCRYPDLVKTGLGGAQSQVASGQLKES